MLTICAVSEAIEPRNPSYHSGASRKGGQRVQLYSLKGDKPRKKARVLSLKKFAQLMLLQADTDQSIDFDQKCILWEEVALAAIIARVRVKLHLE